MSSTDDILQLNVGGVVYMASRSTLTKYPDSLLGAMFASRYAQSATLLPSVDKDGNHFIDRSGRMFEHILNYLRTGRLCLPSDFKDYELLEAEADFYQILPLIEELKSIRSQPSGAAAGGHGRGLYLEMEEFNQTKCVRIEKGPPKVVPYGDFEAPCGLVISGEVQALVKLPLPPEVSEGLRRSTGPLTVIVNCQYLNKFTLVNHLQATGWQLISTCFCKDYQGKRNTLYGTVRLYTWYLPANQ